MKVEWTRDNPLDYGGRLLRKGESIELDKKAAEKLLAIRGTRAATGKPEATPKTKEG